MESPAVDTPAYKRMIICCDGTWQASDRSAQSGGSNDSNVTKFSRALAKTVVIGEQTVQQIVYYISGVGTNALTNISQYVAGGLGLGLVDNVIEAYNFLALNYETGDEIFLFGFSRGAYTARALAGLVSAAGVLDRASLERSSGMYQAYQEGEVAFAKFQQNNSIFANRREPNIKVVGCWDTVGSLGIPQTWLTWFTQANKRDEFSDTNLSDKIENAFHALALKEHRKPFSPTLWNLPPGSTTNLVQCWFPGVHISVGGGTDAAYIENAADISEITLGWMMEMCRPFLEFDPVTQHITLRRHNRVQANGGPGWGLGIIADSYTWLYRPAFSQYRTPGQYNPGNNNVSDLQYIAKGSREYMHASVRIREGAHARTRALVDFELVEDAEAFKPDTVAAKDGLRSGRMWVKRVGNDTVEIPEMRIMGGEYSAERDLMSVDTQKIVSKGTKTEVAELSLLD